MVKKFFGWQGNTLNYAIGIIAGCDFLLFGYGPYISSHLYISGNPLSSAKRFQTKV